MMILNQRKMNVLLELNQRKMKVLLKLNPRKMNIFMKLNLRKKNMFLKLSWRKMNNLQKLFKKVCSWILLHMTIEIYFNLIHSPLHLDTGIFVMMQSVVYDDPYTT